MKSYTSKEIAGLSVVEKRALLARLLRDKAEGPKTCPLAFAQERLWFLDQLSPGSPAYNIFSAVRLSGRLNVAALQLSFNEIVRRHETLRTIFPAIEGQPVQVIAPSAQVKLSVAELGHLPLAEREEEARRLAEEERHRPFDLRQGPLLRTSLLRLGEADHIVLVTMHHIISDGWSLNIFTREMGVLYEAFCAGRPSPLPELSIQYADFVRWQRERLQGDLLEAQLSYWKRQLAGIPLLLELPTDRPRPPLLSFRGASRSLALSEPLSESLQSLGRREGVTLFMIMLAAFQALLSRYTGQSDICVGIPIAGRHRLETENLIGFFVNTQVMRVKPDGEQSFSELLNQTRETVLAAHEHQDVPFEKIVETLQPKRSLSHPPLAQVGFVFVVAPRTALETPGLKLSNLSTANETTKFDLTFFVTEAGKSLELTLQYNTDLFDEQTIQRMLDHYRNLLESIARNPQQRLWQLPLLSRTEKHQLLIERNETRTDYPRSECVHRLFEEQVERTPAAIAVSLADECLTYAELNRRANRLARHLRELGVGPEVRVGLLMERSIEMVIALLGILKASGVYVPLDPQYPRERLQFMLADMRAAVVLTQQRLLEMLPAESDAQVLCLDADWEKIARRDEHNLEPSATADNLAYLIYTSGSTGWPKGVGVVHRAVVRLVRQTNYADFGPESVCLQLAPISFDASTLEIWGSLLNGGRLVLMPPGQPSLEELAQTLRRSRINMLWLAAGLFHLMVDNQLAALQSVEQLLAGGDVLSVPHVEKFLSQSSSATLINGYGPTENTTFTCCHPMKGAQRFGASVPIGRPISNTTVYVLDRFMQPVAQGVVGELYIGGDGLARSYFNQPELTAEKFIPHPFTAEPGARLYRSGDMVRYLPDGNLEFLGRLDQQVKVRGFRVEPGEVEAILGQHSAVLENVVVARQDGAGDQSLVAYLVAREGQPLAVNEVRSYLKERLPDYLIPSTFVLLDELPLTPNGKIDYAALPTPDQTRLTTEKVYVAPRNALESQLAQIWEELLNVRPVGVGQSFFELGGHSLLAVRLMARIHKQFGYDLPLSALFQGETIEDLALIIGRQSTDGWRWSPLVPIQPRGTQPPFFCVHAIGGNVNNFYHLAHHLGVERPFYGLQAPQLHQLKDEEETIEQMAAQYLEAVRAVQPNGPYLLGGYSFGSLVAYEMARQLQAQEGQRVSLLALIDTYSPLLMSKLPKKRDVADMLVSLAWVTSREKGQHLLLSIDELRRLEFDEQLDYFLEKMRAANLAPSEVDHQLLSRFLKGSAARQRAAYCYLPQKYAGRITVFRCEERDALMIQRLEQAGADPHDPTLGWGGLTTGRVEVFDVPGHHDVVCHEPFVKTLAERLQTCLDQAEL